MLKTLETSLHRSEKFSNQQQKNYKENKIRTIIINLLKAVIAS